MVHFTFVPLSRWFTLTHADLAWQPQNKLSLHLEQLRQQAVEWGVELEQHGVVSLPEGGPWALPGADTLTPAMYRTHGRGPLPLELLSELLCQHTAKEVHATLAALLEYLLLPGTVSDWLPAPSAIPLKYAGVLDLHMYPLASQVADAIVASLPFSSNIRTDGFPPAQWDLAKMPATTLPRAAYFAICSEELYRDGRLTGEFGTAVYRVGIPHYQPWPPQRSNYPVWTTAPLEQIFGAASRSGRSVRLHDLADRCIGGRTALGGCVAVELQAAVSSIAVQGRTGAVRVECQVGAHTNDSLYALWAVAW